MEVHEKSASSSCSSAPLVRALQQGERSWDSAIEAVRDRAEACSQQPQQEQDEKRCEDADDRICREYEEAVAREDVRMFNAMQQEREPAEEWMEWQEEMFNCFEVEEEQEENASSRRSEVEEDDDNSDEEDMFHVKSTSFSSLPSDYQKCFLHRWHRAVHELTTHLRDNVLLPLDPRAE